MIDNPLPVVRAEFTITTDDPVVAAEAVAKTPTVPVYAPVEATLRTEPSVLAPPVRDTTIPVERRFAPPPVTVTRSPTKYPLPDALTETDVIPLVDSNGPLR